LIAAILCLGAIIAGSWVIAASILLALLILTGLGVAIPQMSFFGPYACRGNSGSKCVALTFDDGPDERSTPALLEVLREHQVEAAFFVIGRKVDAAPRLANQILRDGHLLENHSFAHSNATNFYSVERLTAELAMTQRVIEKHTGTTPHYYRPPVGLSNPNTFQAARNLGLKVLGWSIRSLDTRDTDPERIVRRIQKQLRPDAIILLHDGNIPAERLVTTTKLLLAKLREEGYEIRRLDRMLE